jgi:hypothetical protein
MNGFFWHDWAGLLGVLLMLGAFALLQAHKLHGNGLTYQLMNLIGAIGILLSLVFGNFNLAAFVQELAWFAIAAYGIAKGVRMKRNEHSGPFPDA